MQDSLAISHIIRRVEVCVEGRPVNIPTVSKTVLDTFECSIPSPESLSTLLHRAPDPKSESS